MGFGVAGVMGAKFAAPDRPCVSVCGDGAFFMYRRRFGTPSMRLRRMIMNNWP